MFDNIGLPLPATAVLGTQDFINLTKTPSVPRTSAQTSATPLNDLLQPGQIIELAGPESSLKTVLALHLAFSDLVRDRHVEGYWVDTDWRFDVHAVVEILKANHPTLSDNNVTLVLDRLHVAFRTTIPQLASFLDELRRRIETDEEVKEKNEAKDVTRFIIIDLFPLLFTPLREVSDRSNQGLITSQGYALLVELMHKLSALARDHSFCVLLVNSASQRHTSSLSSPLMPHKFNLDLHPSLHPTLSFLTDTTLGIILLEDLETKAKQKQKQQKAGTTALLPSDWTWIGRMKDEGRIVHVLQVMRSRNSASGMIWAFAVGQDLAVEVERVPM